MNPLNPLPTESAARRPLSRDMAKILGDCRDIAIHRLLLSFTAMLERVGDMLMERASRTDVREEQVVYLEARDTLQQGRSALMAEFERRLRSQIDDRIAGKVAAKADFSKVESDKLTLIDTHAMDESVVTGNITRVVENLCHDELLLLNRGIGHLLGQPELETDRNPFAPTAIVDGLRGVAADDQGRAPGQVHDPEGAQPGVARRDQRHLRRSQQAPAESPRRARGRAAEPSLDPPQRTARRAPAREARAPSERQTKTANARRKST